MKVRKEAFFYFNSSHLRRETDWSIESLFLTIETGISNFGQVVQATSKRTTNADHKKALKLEKIFSMWKELEICAHEIVIWIFFHFKVNFLLQIKKNGKAIVRAQERKLKKTKLKKMTWKGRSHVESRTNIDNNNVNVNTEKM